MRIKLVSFLVYQLALLLWCFKLHQHFFEFTAADQGGLAITALLPLFLLRFRLNFTNKLLWIVQVVLPLGLLPAINYFLNYFSDAWILIYLVLFLCGSFILLAQSHALTLAGIGATILVWFIPSNFLPNQTKYYDRLTQTIKTRTGEVDLVSWKNDQWIYYNNALVLSTADGHMHAETMAHTTLPFFKNPRVLLIGDDFGYTKKEVLKYPCEIIHLPYDQELSPQHHMAPSIMEYLASDSSQFDVILIDLPDPQHTAFRHYYEEYFYDQCLSKLSSNGILMTNAGSYYGQSKSYQGIDSILRSQGLSTHVLQALIPTLGHRAWVMGARQQPALDQLSFEAPTRWFDQDALKLIRSKGKESYPF